MFTAYMTGTCNIYQINLLTTAVGFIINLLLDVLVCSIAVYFYSLFVF